VAFIIYSVMVPAATVPALFAAGLFPGLIAAACLLVPAILISRRHGYGRDFKAERPPLLRSLVDAVWGLLAPVIILGGLRAGIFTPTEAAVVAVAYGVFVGMVIYRSISFKGLFRLFVEAGELSAVVLMIIGIASVFAWAGNTLGVFDGAAKALVELHSSEWLMLLSINLLLLVAGMFLDAVSIFLILLPLLVPIANAMGWDLVWFGVMMTINLAIGQFTPPMAISLMITSRIAGVGMQETFRTVIWLMIAMLSGLAIMIAFPQIALWLPGRLGYL
jgi:tripartite ATP-independent transporter DctM subunit